MIMTILSIKVENRAGILWKITHLFRSRNFNIESISVGPTEDPEFSRITISMNTTDDKQVIQIIKQLNKLIDTIEVAHLDEHKTVFRELALFKIRLGGANDSMEVNKLVSAYNGTIHDARRDSLIVELTATPDQIYAFEELARPFGIIEVARTGVTALQRAGA